MCGLWSSCATYFEDTGPNVIPSIIIGTSRYCNGQARLALAESTLDSPSGRGDLQHEVGHMSICGSPAVVPSRRHTAVHSHACLRFLADGRDPAKDKVRALQL